MAKIILKDGYDDALAQLLAEIGIDINLKPVKGFGYISIGNITYGFGAFEDGTITYVPNAWLTEVI